MSTLSSGESRSRGSDLLIAAIRNDRMDRAGLSEDFLSASVGARNRLNDAVSKTYEKYCQLVGERLDAIPIVDQDRFSAIVDQLVHFSPSHPLDAKGSPDLKRPFEEIQELADFPEMYAGESLRSAFEVFVADRVHEHGRHLEEASKDPVLRSKLLAEGVDKVRKQESKVDLTSEAAMKQAQEQARIRAEQAAHQRERRLAVDPDDPSTYLVGTLSRQEALREIERDASVFSRLDPELQADREIALAAIRRQGRPALLDGEHGVTIVDSGWTTIPVVAPTELEADREVAAATAFSQAFGPGLLQYLTPELQADREIVREAVKQDGLALQFAAPELQADREIVREAVKQDGLALQYAAPELKADPEIVLEAVQGKALAFRLANPGLRIDRAFVTEAVRRNGMVLNYVAPDLRTDPRIMLAAVGQDGLVMVIVAKVAPQIVADTAFLLEAVRLNEHVLKHVASGLRADRTFMMAAVRSNGRALQYASPELQADYELQIAAAQLNPWRVQMLWTLWTLQTLGRGIARFITRS